MLRRIEKAVTSVVQGGSFSERWRALTAEDPKIKGREIFSKMQRELMDSQTWTFEAFRMYNLKLYDLYGGNKAKARPEQKRNELNEDFAERIKKWESDVAKSQDPSVRALRQKLKILDSMNAVELASNHKSVFQRFSKRLIAQKAKVSLKEVDSLILEHDALRADRKWYQTRNLLKLPLPMSMEERERWSVFDRPFSRSELQLAKANQERFSKSVKRGQKSPKRISSYVFRTPSKRLSRWNTTTV